MTAPLSFRFDQFGIQYTNRCDYRCAHCGTDSGGEQPTWNLGTDYIGGLLPVLRNLGFDQVTITGGECLKFEDDVNALVAQAKALDLSTKVISNGSWAHTDKAAQAMLGRLATSGLDILAVSYDWFRQAFGGSIAHVKHILEANRLLPRKLRIQVYSLETSPDDKRQNAILAELQDLVPVGDLFVQRMIPVGRARLLPPRLFFPVPREQLDKPCYQVFSPFLDHERRLYRCCSGYDLKEHSPLFLDIIDSPVDLDGQLTRLRNEMLHRALAALGPSRIFADAFRKQSEFVTLCHFCVRQMAKPDADRHIHDFLGQQKCLVSLVYEMTQDALATESSPRNDGSSIPGA